MESPSPNWTSDSALTLERKTLVRLVELNLRDGMQRLRAGALNDVSALHEPMRVLCKQATATGAKPEQLLIAVKTVWFGLSLPESADRGLDQKQRESLIALLIATCYG